MNQHPPGTQVRILNSSHADLRTGDVVTIVHYLPNLGGYEIKKSGNSQSYFANESEITSDLQQVLL